MNKRILILYTRSKCPLCDKAKKSIMELKGNLEFYYREVDIDQSDELTEKYGLMIPVVEIDGEEIQYGHIDKTLIQKTFSEKNNN